jgi:hypothetical protein
MICLYLCSHARVKDMAPNLSLWPLADALLATALMYLKRMHAKYTSHKGLQRFFEVALVSPTMNLPSDYSPLPCSAERYPVLPSIALLCTSLPCCHISPPTSHLTSEFYRGSDIRKPCCSGGEMMCFDSSSKITLLL